MRKYIFGTGLISSFTSGLTLLRGLRNDEPFTWRQALAWLSWAITVALAIGAVVDTRRASHGHLIAEDSSLSHKEQTKLLRKQISQMK